MQNSSHLFLHCLWYSSSIPLLVASSLFSFSFSLFSLRYSDFLHPRGVQEDSWGEILSVYQTYHLELSSFLCQACHVTLLFQVKTETLPLLFCLPIYHFLSSVNPSNPSQVCLFFALCVCVRVHVVCAVACNLCLCACVCVWCVCVCFVVVVVVEMNMLICFCKCPGLP